MVNYHFCLGWWKSSRNGLWLHNTENALIPMNCIFKMVNKFYVYFATIKKKRSLRLPTNYPHPTQMSSFLPIPQSIFSEPLKNIYMHIAFYCSNLQHITRHNWHILVTSLCPEPIAVWTSPNCSWLTHISPHSIIRGFANCSPSCNALAVLAGKCLLYIFAFFPCFPRLF